MLPLISKYVPGILYILLSSQIPYVVSVIIPPKKKNGILVVSLLPMVSFSKWNIHTLNYLIPKVIL